MASLVRCTDDLLQQRAVQSSHYERLERQLLERERRKRAIIMTLKQRIADVERRGNDVADLHHERAELNQKLAQHGLQLAALQCRAREAQRARQAAVERLHDGVRGWSGHPASIVMVMQALVAQRRVRAAAVRLGRVLRSVLQAVGLLRHIRVLRSRCDDTLRWHAALHAALRQHLHQRSAQTKETHETAVREAAEAQDEVAGPLKNACNEATQKHLLLEARHEAAVLYDAALRESCAAAQADVVALTSEIDAQAVELTAWEQRRSAAAAMLAQQTSELALRESAYEASRASYVKQQREVTDAATEAAEALAVVQGSAVQRAECRDAALQRAQTFLKQAMVAGLVGQLCRAQQERREDERKTQEAERQRAEEKLTHLRVAHAEHLRTKQATRAAAQLRSATEALTGNEAQLRKAAVGLEEDEWRLLHAQLVRDACRARAAAAAAAAAAAEAERKRKSARKVTQRATSPSERSAGTKRGRAAQVSARTTAAAAANGNTTRRPRVALEAVDYMTITASQSSHTRPVTPLPPAPTPGTAAAAPPRSTRAAYRLVSLRPPLNKKPASAGDVPPSSTAPARKQEKLTRAATAAVAMSPFMAAMSASDSSFSLMQESGLSEAGAAEMTEAVRRVSGGRAGPPFSSSSSNSPPSPSPRCPAGLRRHSGPADARPATTTLTATAGAAALPRRVHQQQRKHEATVHAVAGSGGALGVRPDPPRSALGSALLASRTPRPAVLGSASAMPAVGAHRAQRGGAAGNGGGGRRRAFPMVATASGAADDLFTDLFS